MKSNLSGFTGMDLIHFIMKDYLQINPMGADETKLIFFPGEVMEISTDGALSGVLFSTRIVDLGILGFTGG